MLRAMAGFNGVAIPAAILGGLGPLGSELTAMGISEYLGGGARFVAMYGWIVVLMTIALAAPNTQQVMCRFEPALAETIPARSLVTGLPTWMPNWRWASVIGLIGAAGILSLNRVSEFLYFQF
jgi:hypothetical protein